MLGAMGNWNPWMPQGQGQGLPAGNTGFTGGMSYGGGPSAVDPSRMWGPMTGGFYQNFDSTVNRNYRPGSAPRGPVARAAIGGIKKAAPPRPMATAMGGGAPRPAGGGYNTGATGSMTYGGARPQTALSRFRQQERTPQAGAALSGLRGSY